jgi:LmbE family N-acetylglucosaminyl deacetylase
MIRIHLHVAGGGSTFASLADALATSAAQETLLFLCPHDDDAAIGAGLTLALAAAEGFAVHVAVVTDGSLGYCNINERSTIIETRHRETIAAYAKLGIPESHLHFCDYPDGQLYQYIGRRPAKSDDPTIAGYTGLQNDFTYLIRKLAPQRIFLPAGTDIHPDHQAVYKDLLISLYHAEGTIWPELGPRCAIPQIYEYPTYVTMAEPPELMIEGDADLLERKLDSIRCFASQRQIDIPVNAIREAGPIEFLRNIRFAIYHPAVYRALFAVGRAS